MDEDIPLRLVHVKCETITAHVYNTTRVCDVINIINIFWTVMQAEAPEIECIIYKF